MVDLKDVNNLLGKVKSFLEEIGGSVGKSTQANVLTVEKKSVKKEAKPAEKMKVKKFDADYTEKNSMFLTTLYVFEQGSKLSIQGQRFMVSKNDVVLLSVPCLKIETIVILGSVYVTSEVNNHCMYNKLPIIFLSINGNFKGRVVSDNLDNAKNMKKQMFFGINHEKSLEMAKKFITGKISNYSTMVKKLYPQAKDELYRFDAYIRRVNLSTNQDELRGYEGGAAKEYFEILKDEFRDSIDFYGRQKRPPKDMMNAMLSFGYTILFANIVSIIIINNLNPYLGIFHKDKDGHATLASDMIEEFRAFGVDIVVIEAFRKEMFTVKDFTLEKNGACNMTIEAKKRFIGLLEQNFNKEFLHKQTGYKVSLRRLIDLQVKNVRHTICDGDEEYLPMLF